VTAVVGVTAVVAAAAGSAGGTEIPWNAVLSEVASTVPS